MSATKIGSDRRVNAVDRLNGVIALGCWWMLHVRQLTISKACRVRSGRPRRRGSHGWTVAAVIEPV